MAGPAKPLYDGCSIDLIDGGPLQYHVPGLSTATPLAIIEACTAQGVPQRGEVFAPGLIVVGGPRVVKMRDFSAVVEVVFGPAETPESGGGNSTGSFSLSTRIVSEVTNMDAGGQTIKLRNNPNKDGMNVPFGSDKITTQGVDAIAERKQQTGEVNKYVPITVLRVSRVEKKLPIYLAYRLVGRTNKAVFCGLPPEYWLCAAVEAETTDRNRTFNCTYELWGNEYGWLTASLYRLETGELTDVTPSRILNATPPRLRWDENAAINNDGGTFKFTADQTQFNGMTLVRVQNQGDFSKLNIQLPSNIDADFT